MTAQEFDRQRWAKGDTIILNNGMVCDVNGVNFYKRLVFAYNKEMHGAFSYGFEEILSHDEHETPAMVNMKQFKEKCRKELGLKGVGIIEAFNKISSIKSKVDALAPMLSAVERSLDEYKKSLEEGIESLKNDM